MGANKSRNTEMIVMVMMMLLFAGNTAAETSEECFNNCLFGCDVPPRQIQACIQNCNRLCNNSAAATDSRKVYGRLQKH
ncbi:hypothetical protein DITRI_Ditri19aG0110500 [Diplodiscus trichospermus]